MNDVAAQAVLRRREHGVHDGGEVSGAVLGHNHVGRDSGAVAVQEPPLSGLHPAGELGLLGVGLVVAHGGGLHLGQEVFDQRRDLTETTGDQSFHEAVCAFEPVAARLLVYQSRA